MYNNKKCADYFKSRNEYKRCFREFRKKWKSFGRAAGRINLLKTSLEERQAIGGIIGRVFYEEDINFSFSEFEQGLQKTRFAPVDIKEVLEEYFKEKLVTAKDRKEEEEERRKEFFERIYRYFRENDTKEGMALLWLQEMIQYKKYGYRILIREYAKSEMQAELSAQNIMKALIKIKEIREASEEYPLAVLSAVVTDNPHYFDRDTASGMLLIHAICYMEGTEFPENAHQWRELLQQVSIVPDNISSTVHAFGLRLRTKEGRHPAYDAFCDRGEPYVITMENMKGIVGVEPVEKVYVVENEMVFGYLINNIKNLKYTLLCTSGQPRAVSQVLIKYILDAGVNIYYNGDIDPDGVRIADRLWQRFGDNIYIWRMTPGDYKKSISKEKIGELGRTKLENISHPILKETAECIKEYGMAGYQENMLKTLLCDMEN